VSPLASAADNQLAGKGISAKGLSRIMIVIVVLWVMIPIIVVAVILVTNTTLVGPSIGAENPVGLNVTKDASGNWLISVNSGGGQNLVDVTLSVTDPDTGASALSTKLSAIPAADGFFNDTNNDQKINGGDSILLNHTAAISAGMKVQLLKGESVLGTIKALPA
jgi:hypothetical protein